jgi:hypothetical protein
MNILISKYDTILPENVILNIIHADMFGDISFTRFKEQF